MKRFVFIFCFVGLFYTSAFGQIELGAYAGLDNSKLYGDKIPRTKYKSKIGFQLGASVDIPISDLISLSIQPGYIKNGSKIQVPDTVENEYKDSISFDINYLQLPIYIKIQSKSKRLYFSSGLEILYGLSLKAENELQEIDITQEMNRLNLSLAFGLGYKIPIRKSILYFEVRYAQGLINVAKPAPEDEYYLPRVKLGGLKLVTGFQIPISKKNK